MEGQLSIFDFPEFLPREIDYTYDRDERKHEAPSWMRKERCENCIRWVRYPKDEQPPCGWGIKGYCNANMQKCGSTGYCNSFEKR